MITNNIICMKWGTKYGPEYVNKLYNMVARNMTLPFRFVCFTDDSKGLQKGIEVMPLPEMDLPEGKERGWRKLSTLKNDFPLEGTVLFIDLDTIIVDNIDDFFKIEGEFLIIKHWKPSAKQSIGESAVYRYQARKHHDIYEYFVKNMDEVKANYRHEQAYLVDTLIKQNKISFWPAKWVPSFKYDCMRPFFLGLFQEPRIPEGAKMIIFHGNPTPDQAKAGKIKGIKKLVRHLRPAAWIKKYWK